MRKINDFEVYSNIGVTMMPGDSQSKTMAIAADATAGNCQNCSVLHQVRSSSYTRKHN